MYIRPSRPDEIYHASHKYFMKIGEGKNARYFYTRNEYEAYKKEKGKKHYTEHDANELKQDLNTIHNGESFNDARKRNRLKKRQAEKLDIVAGHHRRKREQEAADKYGHKAPPGESSAPKKRPRSRKKNVKKVISKIILGSRVGGKKLGGGRNGKS